ncbi:TPA: hypothetical protein IUT19_002842, partial [Enterococcus faecalis]|nr:hypothetical protein [Enterococcus faecalis]
MKKKFYYSVVSVVCLLLFLSLYKLVIEIPNAYAESEAKSENVVVNPIFLDGHDSWSWISWGDQSSAIVTEQYGDIWDGSIYNLPGKVLADHGKATPTSSNAWARQLPDPFAGMEKWAMGDILYQDILLPTNKTITTFEFSAYAKNSAQKIKDENGTSIYYTDGSGLKVEFLNSADEVIDVFETGPSVQFSMTKLSLAGSVPANSVKARIQLVGYAGYPYWIDSYWANVEFYYYSKDSTEPGSTTEPGS